MSFLEHDLFGTWKHDINDDLFKTSSKHWVHTCHHCFHGPKDQLETSSPADFPAEACVALGLCAKAASAAPSGAKVGSCSFT